MVFLTGCSDLLVPFLLTFGRVLGQLLGAWEIDIRLWQGPDSSRPLLVPSAEDFV